MKKLLLVALILALPVAVLAADETDCYSWEDGGTMIGLGYTPENMFIANTTDLAYDGTHSLEIYETGGTGTPQAYVAWINGLQEGETVTATVQTWDPTAGTNPSLRIWGHWTQVGGTIDDYYGSAGGSSVYSGPAGEPTAWFELGYTWTMDATHAGMGLVVELRPYNGTPWLGSTWADYLCVTHPETATVTFPGGGSVPVQDQTWGNVKGLYR